MSLTVSPKLPGPRSDPNDVVSYMLFNTGPFKASGVADKVDWWNKSDTPLRMAIVRARIWLGVDGGQKCDCHAELSRSDGSILHVLQADHYVDGPHGAAIEVVEFNHPNYAFVEPNEALALTYFANGFGKVFNAHFTLTLWWKWMKP